MANATTAATGVGGAAGTMIGAAITSLWGDAGTISSVSSPESVCSVSCLAIGGGRSGGGRGGDNEVAPRISGGGCSMVTGTVIWRIEGSI